MNLAEVAQIWNSVGVSTIPVRTDGTKRPSVAWGQYQVTLPTPGELSEWWPNGHSTLGLALICGNISGNLEMCELEAAAAGGENLDAIRNELSLIGFEYLWNRLTDGSTYMEWTPSGGIHFLYRITDAPVPGNTKIAVDEGGKVLAETRGEGGYVIVAPTSGLCHPSGESWSIAAGQYGRLASFSFPERQLVHACIAKVLDRRAPMQPKPEPPANLPAPVSGARPGDAWGAVTEWDEILEPLGWTLSHRTGVEEYWVRPGKSKRDGHSATTNYQGSGLLKVFSSSIPELEPDATYTKFGAWTLLTHGGDYKAATLELAGRGFGSAPVFGPMATLDTMPLPASVSPELHNTSPEPPGKAIRYTLDEMGTAQRLWERVQDGFRYVHEEKIFYQWNTQVWEKDHTGAIHREYIRLTETLLEESKGTEGKAAKWADRSRSNRAMEAAIKVVSRLPGASVSAATFDPLSRLINLGNGVLDMDTDTLLPHDPSYLMTRMMGGDYDPAAQSPMFDKFIAEVLPDPEIRDYVQRAVGYSMLGDADQRALFLIHGPSGTGKSAFIEIISKVLGSYSGVAPAGTFKESRGEKGANPDLHRLRGKRFVTTSETGENTSFDEDLLKRVTGRDSVSSRGLYQDFVDWSPECTVWIATNHPPKFNSDDDAIWRRAKLVPFMTQFGRGDTPEIFGIGTKIVKAEANGILNWVLAGVRAYLQRGLDEPEAVQQAATTHRESTDSVLRFFDETVADGLLAESPEGRIRTTELHAMYLTWAQQNGERPLGSRRFINRLSSSRPHLSFGKKSGHMVWFGLSRVVMPGVGLVSGQAF